ncbi:DUF748 domain-containing protein [Maridesulfovibrio hydrothermalis]|uniref:DUF748 domain-containing protein n=1 Tax=Maridesulfovibrio hydrothermalis AM13 = DSM 14728 TaxID=1121451 RepID=L0RAC6_9BACT|nr:DUF748 domain-containing protein [Maridesulfovibrio hydrothermalis]CCO23167.1 conserved exported protein of unknown function [Maridesulfovibrio hydrothermalis AM13 = DSM 14728]
MLKKIRNKWNQLDKWRKAGVIVAGLLVFYTLVGFFLIPFTARKVALSKLPEVLNRPVNISRIDFNPYTLHLKIEGFEIGKKEGEGNLLSFKLFDINFDSFSLFRFSAIFDHIIVVDPQVDFSIFRGGSSVSDLIPEQAATDEPVENADEQKSLFPFIVRNLVITNGTCRVYDKVRNMQHVVDNVDLMIPFTSSLSRDNEKQVQPTLNMIINGTPFELKGHSLPFNETLKTEFIFSLKNAQLDEYWAYLPIYETTDLKSGSFSTSLTLSLERSENILPRVIIRGKANISNFDLTARKGPSFLKFKDLDIKLDEISILRRILKVGSVKLTDPYLKIGLKKDGGLDILDYIAPSIEAGKKSKKNESEEGPALAALVSEFILENGQVDFTDNAFSDGFHKKIGPISIRAEKISTTKDAAGSYDFKIGSNATEIISGHGSLGLVPLSVNGSVAVADLDIPDYHIYFDDPLPLDIGSGRVGAGSDFVFTPASETVRLSNIRVEVDNLALTPKGGGRTLIGLGGFAMTNGTVDVKEKSVFIDSINLNKALIKLMRDSKGIDLVQHLEKHKQSSAAKAAVPAEVILEEEQAKEDSGEVVSVVDEKKWKVALNKFSLTDSAVEFTDKAATKTTSVNITGINAGVRELTFPEEKPVKLSLAANINKRGSISVKGEAGLQPLKGQGSVEIRKFRLRDFNGYLPSEMQMNIARGHIDVRGNWSFTAGDKPSAAYTGRVQLKDLLIRDNQGNRKFFHLSELAVRDIDFTSSPLKVKAGSIAVLAPNIYLEREADGTFNAGRMLTGKRADPVNATLVEKQAEEAAKKSRVASVPAAVVSQVQTDEVQDSVSGGRKDNFIFVDKMYMTNGTVIFKDHTVDPAFELDITKMRSAVYGLELPQGQRTDLSFNATFDQQAPLVVEGYLQPTAGGADTDLKISLINLDMTQLSPYTEKFIAYPVSTGMLSSDVSFKLRGKSVAVENVFDIYQFDVGEKVDNPDAPNIPIGFGLALLRDSSGNIRLDIPVEGDLADPQFRLGRVIGAAIVNILVKAVTSPFALIGALVGGGEDMDVLLFAPGTAQIKEDELAKVESVAKAMQDRPGLKLEISGFTSPDDIPALEEMAFRRQVAMPKFLELEGDENAPDSVDEVVVSEEEYPEYLEAAYKDATFERPTNFLGIVTAQPLPDMEKALRDHIKITDTQLAELSRSRAEIIRTLLTEKFGVAPERVFLKGMSATGKGTGPRVELGLQ